MRLYAGLDWASAEHAVCVIDGDGAIVERFTVAHTAEGLAGLVRRLDELALAHGVQIPIAIERPSGLLVDTLTEAGQLLVAIHPNVVKATRPRYRSSGAKSDPGDAYLLADLLRTDGRRFRPLEPLSDEVRALRSKCRTRDDLVATRVQLANQLRSLLEGFWPGAAVIFNDIDSPIALDFLDRFPAPRDGAKLDEKRLAKFLATHGYPGRRPPAELLGRLRAAPIGRAGELEEESKRAQVQALVPVLRQVVAQIAKLTASIEHDVELLGVGRIVMSLPRTGRVNAAQIASELGEDPDRFTDGDHLAAEAGVVPVTHASGKHLAVVCRFACNKRLRRAITCWADNSRHSSDWAATIYRRARSRGCDHPHAVRILARAWCRVLWRCWKDGVAYDAAKHRAAAALQEQIATAEI